MSFERFDKLVINVRKTEVKSSLDVCKKLRYYAFSTRIASIKEGTRTIDYKTIEEAVGCEQHGHTSFIAPFTDTKKDVYLAILAMDDDVAIQHLTGFEWQGIKLNCQGYKCRRTIDYTDGIWCSDCHGDPEGEEISYSLATPFKFKELFKALSADQEDLSEDAFLKMFQIVKLAPAETEEEKKANCLVVCQELEVLLEKLSILAKDANLSLTKEEILSDKWKQFVASCSQNQK